MELFPLWNVSSVARSQIINRMNPAEVIELAIRYKPFRDFLSIYKLPAVDLEWNFCKTNFKRRVVLKKQTVVLKFPSLKDPVQFDVQKTKKENPIETDIEALQNVARPHKGFVIGNCKNLQKSVEALEEVIKLIAKIAHVKNYTIKYYHDPKVDILSSSVFQLTNTFLSLYLGYLDGAERMKLTEQQIRYLLEDVECDHLSLNCDLEGGPRLLENVKFNQKHLRFGDCDWLHPREFFNNSELRSISGKFTQPCNLEDFIKIVNGWQRGEILQNLCHMKLRSEVDWPAMQGLTIQEDFTVAIVRATGEKFEEFRGEVKRMTDGKFARLWVWSGSVRAKPSSILCFSCF